MASANTTAAVQRYLDVLHEHPGDASSAAIVRDLLGGATGRLQVLCGSLLTRSYPRLVRPPVGLETEDVLSAVVERLIKAMREARPRNVRQFFALANQHMRWELNDIARRLDAGPGRIAAIDSAVAAPAAGDSKASADALRILAAIGDLPDDEREAFDLVRIQGLTQAEAAEVLGVATKTVQRRVQRALVILSESLGDLRPGERLDPDS